MHYLTRVEGHGNIVVDVKDGRLIKCEFQVIESPVSLSLCWLAAPFGRPSISPAASAGSVPAATA